MSKEVLLIQTIHDHELKMLEILGHLPTRHIQSFPEWFRRTGDSNSRRMLSDIRNDARPPSLKSTWWNHQTPKESVKTGNILACSWLQKYHTHPILPTQPSWNPALFRRDSKNFHHQNWTDLSNWLMQTDIARYSVAGSSQPTIDADGFTD